MNKFYVKHYINMSFYISITNFIKHFKLNQLGDSQQ